MPWRGASAGQVEELLVVPLEARVADVPGVRALRARAEPGLAIVDLLVAPGADLEAVAARARARLDEVATVLPDDAGVPALGRLRRAADAVVAVMPGRADQTAVELGVALDQLRTRLLTEAGVRAVDVCGGARARIEVRLDDARVAALGLDAGAVVSALIVEPAAGLDELGGRTVSGAAGEPVRLRDVAVIAEAGLVECHALTGHPGDAIVEVRLDAAGRREPIVRALRDAGARVVIRDLRRATVATAGLPVEARVQHAQRVLSRLPPELAMARVRTEGGALELLVATTPDGAPDGAIDRAVADQPGLGPVRWRGVGVRELEAVVVAPAEARAVTGAGIAASALVPGPGAPDLEVVIDRARAADLGVASSDIARAVALATTGRALAPVRDGARTLELWIGPSPIGRDARPDPATLGAIRVASARGGPVRLADVAALREVPSGRILREDGRRVTVVWARVTGDEAAARRTLAAALPGASIRASEPDRDAW